MRVEHNSRSLIYRKPFGAVTCGEEVTFRISLADFGIPTHIRLVYEFEGCTEYVNMAYVFDFADAYVYEAVLPMPKKAGLLYYYFDIASRDEQIFYGNNSENLGGLGKCFDGVPNNKFQVTVYSQDFETPAWWRESVCYQIFPDRFANGNENGEFLGERCDIIKRNWGDEPFYKPEQFGGKYLANDFFGGNFLGIEKKLPYLAELGISSLYLNPIFKAYSNHKYDTGDYKTIDPMFGTEEGFERLCKKAEEFGIHIILDGVFNHTGSDSLYFNKNGTYDSVGAFQSQDSPYYDWYRFTNYPDEYESWWGIDTLPQIEENCKGYQDYILTGEDSVVKHWLKKGATGWRLDVVDELPDSFVKILRKEVKSQNPKAVIIGEVWEDASNKVAYDEKRQYFMGSELDSVMNYPLKNALIDYINGKIDADGLDARIMSLKENYPRPAFYATLNFLSSHDTVRILTALGGNEISDKDRQSGVRLGEYEKEQAIKKLKCLVSMQMLMPGVPTVFYGDEAGCEGYADPFCRCCFPWGNENTEITEFYKKIIALRNKKNVFKNGEFETIYNFGNCYGFIRYDNNEKYIIIVNPNNEETIRLDVSRYRISRLCGVFHNECYSSEDGIYYINMPEKSAKIFKNEIN